ncbi:hypothetical protein CDD82_4565 [Ophiocordyceps australis]|uniref:Uncharacterized protein n=1 Tax=Ophiocordyceps australis TaxID=1399860 RepID=A0A2C5Z287_9HYPO|nr:hypothetical protein CDD82_4565 [Ophiocordyceps australis]
MDEETRAYAINLDYTLKELQQKVREHENELQKLHQLANVDANASLSPEAQAAIITSALQDVNDSEPFLPAAGSILPALLALRKTHETVVQSEAFLASHNSEAYSVKKQLESERANLRDQRLLADALAARIESLRTAEPTSPPETTPDDRVAKLMQDLEAKKKKYESETFELMKSLHTFIDTHLAVMLAAEELGGPVVGDVVDIDPDDLALGFNAQGKSNKRAKKASDHEDRRQRRIDEIWGAGNDGDSALDEVAAAGREMRQLTEDLLNTLVEAKGDNSASYVKLTRESAAARFLVRSKVAQFHPKDATKLRLIDFGRELAT